MPLKSLESATKHNKLDAIAKSGERGELDAVASCVASIRVSSRTGKAVVSTLSFNSVRRSRTAEVNTKSEAMVRWVKP